VRLDAFGDDVELEPRRGERGGARPERSCRPDAGEELAVDADRLALSFCSIGREA